MSEKFTQEDFQDRDQLALIVRSVLQLIETKNWRAVRDMMAAWEIPEIADVLSEIEKKDRVLLFRALPRQASAEIFSYLEPQDQESLIRDLSDTESRRILAEMHPDDRAQLLSELPGNVSKLLMRLLSPADRAEVQTLLGYPEESCGRLMNPDYVAVQDYQTVAQCLELIRQTGKDIETLNRIYVIDKGGKLIDDLRLRQLVLAEPSSYIKELMDGNFVSLSAFDDREEAVHAMQRYDVIALPVVDSAGELIGIVTHDDVMDVAEEEATEDIQKAASVSPLKMSYSRITAWVLFRKRILWLAALVFFNIVSAGILAMNETIVDQAVSLVAFIPLLLGAAGNAGSQSATIILRGLVTGDIDNGSWLKSFSKEIIVGLLLGGVLGFISYFLGFSHGGPAIGLIVSITMVAIVLVANLVGMTLPFVLAQLRLDPAVASTPLITTIADASGLIIYFSVAAKILSL